MAGKCELVSTLYTATGYPVSKADEYDLGNGNQGGSKIAN